MPTLQEVKQYFSKFVIQKTKPYQALAKHLADNLTDDMSILDIANLALLIEQIKVDNGSFGSDPKFSLPPLPKQLREDLRRNALALREKLLPETLSGVTDNEFLQSLKKLQSFLLPLMNDLMLKANKSEYLSPYAVRYSPSMIASSALQEIVKTTKRDPSSDDKDVSVEFHRGDFRLGDDRIPLGTQERIYRKAIETFAGDKISEQGSQANKIYHYSGQFLYGILMTEFNFATELNGMKVTGLVNRGNVHWRKTKTGEIEGDIELNVFSMENEGSVSLLNTEGNRVQITKRALEDFSKLLDGEVKLRAPIGKLTVKVALASEKNNYYFEPKNVTIQYNAKELMSIREEKPLPRTNKELVNWEPIKLIHKVDLSKTNDIKKSADLLKSFRAEEWRTLNKYLNVSTKSSEMKDKLAQIYVLAHMNMLLTKQEQAPFKTNISKLFKSETEFQGHLDKAHRNLGLIGPEKIVSRFTAFFTRLKENNEDLCLQEPIEILNDAIKEEAYPDVIVARLQYILNLMNTQNNFSLSTTDLNKMKVILDAVKKQYSHPNKIPSMIEKLYKALEKMKLDQKLSSDHAERPLPPKPELFIQKILLNTEARRYVTKIQDARQIVSSQKKLLTESKEIRAIDTLDNKLQKIQKNIIERTQLRALTIGWLSLQTNEIKQAIETAHDSKKQPGNIFEKIIYAIKNLFTSKKPTILEALQQVQKELPDQLEIQSPSPKKM